MQLIVTFYFQPRYDTTQINIELNAKGQESKQTINLQGYRRDEGKWTNVAATLDISYVHNFSPFIEAAAMLRRIDPFNVTFHCAIRPAIVALKDHLVTAFQMTECPEREKPGYRVHKNFIFVQKYDFQLQPKGYGHMVWFGYPNAREGPRDPNAFVLNERPFLAFHPGTFKSTNRTVTTWPIVWDVIDRAPVIPLLAGNVSLSAGRDWLPLVDDKGFLHLIQTLDPLAVLKCNVSGENCQCTNMNANIKRPGSDLGSGVSTDILHLLSTHGQVTWSGGSPFQLYRWPYYISVFTVFHAEKTDPEVDLYTTHLVVLRIDFFRIVFISDKIAIHSDNNSTSVQMSIRPSGLLLQTDDSMLMTATVNEKTSWVFLVTGLKRLMDLVLPSEIWKWLPEGYHWYCHLTWWSSIYTGPRLRQKCACRCPGAWWR